MNEREIADWEREIKHAEKMQEQRKTKTVTFAGGKTYEIKAKESNNEIND